MASSATVSKAVVEDANDFKSRSIQELMSLKGRVTVITGGARGIGLALARGAVELGSDIAIIDILDEPRDELLELENHLGVRAKYYRTDVTNLDQLTDSFDRINSDFGQIDNCITAAGICIDKPFLDHNWEESSRILNINVLGTTFTAQLAAKSMQQQKRGGSIVMIASVVAYSPVPARRLSVYAASKGAVKALMENLAVELAPLGIRVNSISPGFISTEMTMDVANQDPNLWTVFNKSAPLGRIGNRGDLKGIVAYLLSDAAAFTTGTDVFVDGGLHLGNI
ncbi:short chain dehydrogenase [Xylogone sp. PMI_703]|nr:short chain dehydrogenase [Xylogone sp. PMI_703]